MSFDCSEHMQYQLLHLTGEVDLHNSSEVRRCMLDILGDNKPIIIDFSNLKYIDSSGMATLVEGLNIANKNGLSFMITGANGAPLQVLKLTRLDKVFTLIDSVAEIKE